LETGALPIELLPLALPVYSALRTIPELDSEPIALTLARYRLRASGRLNRHAGTFEGRKAGSTFLNTPAVKIDGSFTC
jgi:hypothetical protein